MRETNQRVFFIGSGLSSGCGLPLGGKSLFKAIASPDRIKAYPEDFEFIFNEYYGLKFFYPSFCENFQNFPDIEQFCTLLTNGLKLNPNAQQLKTVLEAVKRQVCLFFNSKQIELKDNFKEIDSFASKHLIRGDVIITTNYDTLIEKALQKTDKKDKISYLYENERISILKLHGSINWLDENNKINKKNNFSKYFYELENTYIGNNFNYVGGDLKNTDNNVYIINPLVDPIYNKIPTTELQKKIWQETIKRLKDAKELNIIGFSLPFADSHIRYLLSFVSSNKCKVKVIDPDVQIKYRFEECFGNNIEFIPTKFELSEFAK